VGALRENRGAGRVIDQDARHRGVFVPFFGHLASTTPTLATLALRTCAPVLPVYCVPERSGGYRLVCEPEVPTIGTGDRESDILRHPTEYTAIVERRVRQYPSACFWTHRRWKTRPPEEKRP
jgi:KDO2-lipid IV(A) lauroyltransferase